MTTTGCAAGCPYIGAYITRCTGVDGTCYKTCSALEQLFHKLLSQLLQQKNYTHTQYKMTLSLQSSAKLQDFMWLRMWMMHLCTNFLLFFLRLKTNGHWPHTTLFSRKVWNSSFGSHWGRINKNWIINHPTGSIDDLEAQLNCGKIHL